jgi:heat-inducible transcriptional repressor
MRLYVDQLVASGNFVDAEELKSQFGIFGSGDVDSIVRSAGLVVSELAQLTSIVSAPEVTEFRLKDLHLSWLSPKRVLVILVTQDGRVFNRTVRLDEPIEKRALQRMQNFLSELVVGLSLREVRRRVRQQLNDAELSYRHHLRRALEIGREVVELATRSELFVEGTVHILEVSELVRDIERARQVMRRLEDRERVLEVLDRVCETPRAQTLIGPELGEPWGDDLSLVACGYFHEGRQVGLVGILGPMRMNYARMIPLVEQAAGVLSKELDELA